MTTFREHMCGTQCDSCHDLDHCVEAEVRVGDLLLCRPCASSLPSAERAGADHA